MKSLIAALLALLFAVALFALLVGLVNGKEQKQEKDDRIQVSLKRLGKQIER